MRITLTDAGKRFNRDWIFRHLHYQFHSGQSYAITGSNGSGKSTLLQVIGGAIAISEGTIGYEGTTSPGALKKPVGPIQPDQVYQQMSLAAPYLEVVEEMTLPEFLDFHQAFKPFLPGLDSRAIIALLGLEKSSGKQIRHYSSGMKQRVKLGQCLFSDTAVVLLDEPCTNLDVDGITLYRKLIGEYCRDRLVIVSSNDRQEYDFCNHTLSILDYK